MWGVFCLFVGLFVFFLICCFKNPKVLTPLFTGLLKYIFDHSLLNTEAYKDTHGLFLPSNWSSRALPESPATALCHIEKNTCFWIKLDSTCQNICLVFLKEKKKKYHCHRILFPHSSLHLSNHFVNDIYKATVIHTFFPLLYWLIFRNKILSLLDRICASITFMAWKYCFPLKGKLEIRE